MPINPSEFNSGETNNSWEQIVYQILGDGKAYSLDELATEVGIISPEKKPNKSQVNPDEFFELVNYTLDKHTFKLTLDKMVEDGRIISKYVSQKDGNSNLYYMRNDIQK